MNDIASTTDIQLLREMYEENEVYKAAFDFLKGRTNDSKETKVGRLRALVQRSGVYPDRGDIVSFFKSLAEAGCGKFVVGRHGSVSRFVWSVSLRSVGSVASSTDGDIIGISSDADLGDEDDDADRDETEDRDDLISHQFVLRPGHAVSLLLPSDLTTREAGRLAAFIKSLPFDDSDPNPAA